MTRRQRRKLYGLPGIAPFRVVEDNCACESCGFYPLDRGDWVWFDDRWELLTCSALCAGKARATAIRELEEWERREVATERSLQLGIGLDHGGDQYGGPTFDGRPGS